MNFNTFAKIVFSVISTSLYWSYPFLNNITFTIDTQIPIIPPIIGFKQNLIINRKYPHLFKFQNYDSNDSNLGLIENE